MARSHNLASYEEALWDLRDAMIGGINEVTLRLPRREATNTQQTFYAFIRAHEHTARTLIKSGKIQEGMELISCADAMRGYLTTVDNSTQPSTLRFINRDLNPKTASMREQIKAQLRNMHVSKPTQALPPQKANAPTSVSSFFDKPLEIHDDGDRKRAGTNPGDNPEEPTA